MNHDPLSLQKLFIGLMPDARVQAALQRHRAEWGWTGSEHLPHQRRLHLTVCSLGGIPASVVPALRKLLRDVPMQPMELVLREPMIFSKNNDKPAVIAADRNEGLLALRASLDEVLARLHYRPPKLSLPHVTLAWNAADARPPAALRPIRWRVEEFALIWSQMGPDFERPYHDVLESWGPGPGNLPAAPVQTRLFA